MAHGGDELILHVLDLLALGDVAHHADEELAPADLHATHAELHREDGPVTALARDLEPETDHLAVADVEMGAEVIVVFLALRLGHEHLEVPPDRLVPGVTEEAFGGRVHGLQRAVLVDRDDAVEDVVDDGADTALALP